MTNGTASVAVPITGASSATGSSTSQAFAANGKLSVAVLSPASGCSAPPSDVNVVIHYRMQQ